MTVFAIHDVVEKLEKSRLEIADIWPFGHGLRFLHLLRTLYGC